MSNDEDIHSLLYKNIATSAETEFDFNRALKITLYKTTHFR